MQTRRVAGNTAAMFIRQVGIVGLNLYTIRILLQTLGLEDYAIYLVVYSLIMIGSFLWGSIKTITQRYIAFAIGASDEERARAFYDVGLVLCCVAAMLILGAYETAGVWFVTEHMDVATERRTAALVLFRAFFIFAVLNVFAVFHAAVILAHEDMRLFAMISILEAGLRLGAALTLSIMPYDQLTSYGVLFSAVAVLITLSYVLTAIWRYPECYPHRPRISLDILRDMLSFSGWTVFGQITTISRVQMITILINQSFAPTTVAARAISMSIGSNVLTFASNFSVALNPPIVKTYAAGRLEEMYDLIYFGSKITFFLVWVVTLPLIATMPGVLHIWLGDYPAQAVIFTRLSLVENAIVAISLPLMAAVRATGKMRGYELTLGAMQIMVLLLSWLLVRQGAPATSVYLVAIAINIAMFGARLAITSQRTGLPVGPYFRAVIGPVTLVVMVSGGATGGILHAVPQAATLTPEPIALAAVAALFALPMLCMLTLGLSGPQRRMLSQLVLRRLGRGGTA